MARTVDELRNDIRTAVGYDIDTDRLPPKSQMRAGIRAAIGEAATDDPDEAGGPFRKADLLAIAEALDG